MSTALLSWTAALAVLLGGALVARDGVRDAELVRALDARFTALHAEGALPFPASAAPSAELAAARDALERWFADAVGDPAELADRSRPLPPLQEPLAAVLAGRDVDPRALAEALDGQAELLARLDALPAVLWSSEPARTPPDAFLSANASAPSAALRGGLRAATALLAGHAWRVARDSDGGAAAGEALARALALHRVTDGGTAADAAVRASLRASVLSCRARIGAERVVDAREFEGPIATELAALDLAERESLAWRHEIAMREALHRRGALSLLPDPSAELRTLAELARAPAPERRAALLEALATHAHAAPLASALRDVGAR